MKKVIICIITAAFCFGTMEVALKISVSSLDPLQITFLRFMIGGFVLLPFGIAEMRRSGYRLSASDIGWVTLIGIIGIPVSMLAFQLGLQSCNAATAAAIVCTNPLFTMLFAHLFTSEKMNRRKTAAFFLGIIAACFLIRPWDIQEGNTFHGLLLLVFASVTFGTYTVMSRRRIARIGAFTQTGLSFILGSLVLFVIMIPLGHPAFTGIISNWAGILYCGLIATGLGYLAYFIAIQYSDASTGSMAIFIKPALAAVCARLILNEDIYWNTVVGIILLLVASMLTVYDTIRARQTGYIRARSSITSTRDSIRSKRHSR